MVEIKRNISNYNWSYGNTPKYIVIHDTGNWKDTDEANANYFNGGDRQASAHYFVDEDSITQVVEESNAAWHCGDRYPGVNSNNPECNNRNSIGIEMCNSGGYISEVILKNTSDLVKKLMQKYNIPLENVIRHYDVSGKICPGNMSADNWSKWVNFKTRLLSNEPKKTGYVVTNYLPHAYEGYKGVDINYVLSYFKDIKCYINYNEKGIWIETQTLTIDKCNELKNILGSWFYAIY